MTHTLPCPPMPQRLKAATLVLLLSTQSLATVAYAHAELLRAEPGNAAQLAAAPAVLTLYYSEPVRLFQIRVQDDADRVVSAAGEVDKVNPAKVTVPLEPLEEGVYRVTWSVLAEGHVTGGKTFFVVGDPALSRENFLALLGGAVEPRTSPLEPVVRFFLYLGVALLLGVGTTFLIVLLPVTRDSSAFPHLRGVLVVAMMMVAWGSLLLVAVQITTLGAAGAIDSSLFTVDGPGSFMILRLLLVAALLSVMANSRSLRTWCVAAVLVGLGGALSLSLSSHAAAEGLSAVSADLGHLLGVSLWAGGLFTLVFFLPKLGKSMPEAEGERVTRAALTRFSHLALLGVAGAVVGGLLLAASFVPRTSALGGTGYGLTLSAKGLLFLLAVGLGAVARYVLVRESSTAGNRLIGRAVSLLRFELALVLGMFGLAGLLTSLPPASLTLDDSDGTVLANSSDSTLTLSLVPGQPGINLLELRSASTPPTRDVVSLTLSVAEGTPSRRLTLEATGDGSYAVLTTLQESGPVRAVVAQGPWQDATFDFELSTPEASILASPPTPFARGLRSVAIGLGVAALIVLAFESYGRELDTANP